MLKRVDSAQWQYEKDRTKQSFFHDSILPFSCVLASCQHITRMFENDEYDKSRITLYEACCQPPPCLMPNRIREAMVRCAFEIGEASQHSEDDSTPEVLLHRSAIAIQGLLENVGFLTMMDSTHFPSSQKSTNCLRRYLVALIATVDYQDFESRSRPRSSDFALANNNP